MLAVTREVVTVLLRAGARLDAVKGQKSAEEVLDDHLRLSNTGPQLYAVRLSNDDNFREIQDMVRCVRAAGWRGILNTRYFGPLVRLRGLANRGKAKTEDRTLALLFGLPPRPFRVVLTFCYA